MAAAAAAAFNEFVSFCLHAAVMERSRDFVIWSSPLLLLLLDILQWSVEKWMSVFLFSLDFDESEPPTNKSRMK